MNAEVTVVIPSYNQAPYLPDALESVLAQTFTNWACIIVDDGSTDNTAEVAERYCKRDGRITYFCVENGGPSKARNLGVEHAQSQYILPLDGDDKISTNYVEECLKKLTTSPTCKVAYGVSEKFGLKNEPWDLGVYSLDRMIFFNCIHPSGMYRKTDWQKMGGYDIQMREGLEDWEFWINFLRDGAKVAKIENITFYWRVKTASRTTLLKGSTIFQRMARYIYFKHADLYEGFFKDPITLYQDYSTLRKNWDWANKHHFRFFLAHLKVKIERMAGKKPTNN